MTFDNAVRSVLHGVKYRSNHEREWAEFLDENNVEYIYEPKKYPVKSEHGFSYTPDFFLCKQGCYLEIKCTSLDSYNAGWFEKIKDFSRQYDGVYVDIIVGKPDDYYIKVVRNGEERVGNFKLLPCENCKDLLVHHYSPLIGERTGNRYGDWISNCYSCGCNSIYFKEDVL